MSWRKVFQPLPPGRAALGGANLPVALAFVLADGAVAPDREDIGDTVAVDIGAGHERGLFVGKGALFRSLGLAEEVGAGISGALSDAATTVAGWLTW